MLGRGDSTAPPERQRGVALLTVMFIMMLLTTLVVYLVEDDQLAVRRVSGQQETEQGFHTAVYAEQWASKVLEQDIRDNDTDHLLEQWNTESPGLDDDDRGELRAQLSDLQGRFNINNLASADEGGWYAAFQRLLSVLELDPALADAVVDWVDADIDPRGHNGAEDDVYTRKNPSYQTANRSIAHVSELSWVHGMTGEALDALRPHVAALPSGSVLINVNTATPEVLQALAPQPVNVDNVIANRGDEGYRSVEEFLRNIEFAGEAGVVAEPLISVTSEYFQVRSEVDLGRYGTVLYSVIERPAATRQARVIQRRRGFF